MAGETHRGGNASSVRHGSGPAVRHCFLAGFRRRQKGLSLACWPIIIGLSLAGLWDILLGLLPLLPLLPLRLSSARRLVLGRLLRCGGLV